MSEPFVSNPFAQDTLGKLLTKQNLGCEMSRKLIVAMMSGEVDPQLIAANLVAWRMQGEKAEEILGAAQAMRELSTKLVLPLDEQPVVDIVGTGGDNSHIFNVSTAACFVVAACKGRVAKHCGRGVSTSSGSTDLLAAMGVNLNATLAEQQARFASSGLVFMAAPNHHPAMRYTAPVRQILKQRTIFNILGPLTNPAGVRRYVLGVFTPQLVQLMAKLLQHLGAERALVVHSHDGLDELSIAAPTDVCELKDGQLHSYTLTQEALGVCGSLEDCTVDGAEHSFSIIQDAFNGKHTNAAKQIAANAGAALYVLGIAPSIQAGVSLALERISQGGVLPPLATDSG